MNSEDNQAQVRRYRERAWSDGELEVADKFCAPTFLHDDGQPFTPERFKSPRHNGPDTISQVKSWLSKPMTNVNAGG